MIETRGQRVQVTVPGLGGVLCRVDVTRGSACLLESGRGALGSEREARVLLGPLPKSGTDIADSTAVMINARVDQRRTKSSGTPQTA